jgi:hypothetical protein
MSEGQEGSFPELAGFFFYPEAELRRILLIKIKIEKGPCTEWEQEGGSVRNHISGTAPSGV